MSSDTTGKRTIDHIDDQDISHNEINHNKNDAVTQQLEEKEQQNEEDQEETQSDNVKADSGNTDDNTTVNIQELDKAAATVQNDTKSDANHRPQRREQRLFGVLMGTLKKFNNENEQKQEQARKRQAIDIKLQERLEQEKNAIKTSLLQDQEERQKRKQQRIEELEQKRTKRVLLHEQELAAFLTTTSSKPNLTYLPKQLLPHQQEKIDEQKKRAADALKEYEERIHQEKKEPINDENETVT